MTDRDGLRSVPIVVRPLDERRSIIDPIEYIVKYVCNIRYSLKNLRGQKFWGIFFPIFLELLLLFGFGWLITIHLRIDSTFSLIHCHETFLIPIIVMIKDFRLLCCCSDVI